MNLAQTHLHESMAHWPKIHRTHEIWCLLKYLTSENALPMPIMHRAHVCGIEFRKMLDKQERKFLPPKKNEMISRSNRLKILIEGCIRTIQFKYSEWNCISTLNLVSFYVLKPIHHGFYFLSAISGLQK